MNRDRVNEAISSWFEPKPEKHPAVMGSIGLSVITEAYPQKYWFFDVRNAPRNGKDWLDLVDVSEWQPLDYFHSEDASARLLEAMPAAMVWQDCLEPRQWNCYADFRVPVREGIWKHPDRKTVIALVFCKFAGIEVSL